MDLKKLKVVLGQDNYHLVFPVECRKCNDMKLGCKTKLGWTLSGPLPKQEVGQVAAVASHVAAVASHVAVENRLEIQPSRSSAFCRNLGETGT